MSTMISKLRRSSRAVGVAVAATALVAGVGAGAAAAAADRALPTTSVTVRDTGWDFTAGRPGLQDRLVVPLSWGDTGWD